MALIHRGQQLAKARARLAPGATAAYVLLKEDNLRKTPGTGLVRQSLLTALALAVERP
jgi:hypothetical protein